MGVVFAENGRIFLGMSSEQIRYLPLCFGAGHSAFSSWINAVEWMCENIVLMTDHVQYCEEHIEG